MAGVCQDLPALGTGEVRGQCQSRSCMVAMSHVNIDLPFSNAVVNNDHVY